MGLQENPIAEDSVTVPGTSKILAKTEDVKKWNFSRIPLEILKI